VLFYVYPLKFCWNAAEGGTEARRDSSERQAKSRAGVALWVGFAAAFLLIAALHVNAWRQREKIGIERNERLITDGVGCRRRRMAGVGLLSCALGLLLPVNHAADAGLSTYWSSPGKNSDGNLFWTEGALAGKAN